MKVSRDTAVNEWDLPYGGTEDVEIVADIIRGTSRWSLLKDLVVRIDNKFYRIAYSEALTEAQYEKPWECEDELEFIEVHKVTRPVDVWEPVSE